MDLVRLSWVYDYRALQTMEEDRKCLCGNTLDDQDLWQLPYYRTTGGEFLTCGDCRRNYLKLTDLGFSPPDLLLDVEEDSGLYKVEGDKARLLIQVKAIFGLLDMHDYVEIDWHDYEFWVYVRNGMSVGCIGVIDEDVINAMAVAPGYQRRGYGSSMLLQWAEERGLDRIEITGCFEDVIEFYEKVGVDVVSLKEGQEID